MKFPGTGFVVARLTLIAFICGTSLSLTNLLTSAPIEVQRAEYAEQQLRQVLDVTRAYLTLIEPYVYQIDQSDHPGGHIFQIVTNNGYNGEIKLWLAVAIDGTVRGVRVISHNETPGLADDLALDVSDWILSFNGESLSSRDWRVKKDGGDFDQFTGATITPRAVVAAVKQGLSDYPGKQADWSDLGSEKPASEQL
ncbi:MAG: RnfABCDGE type electron transport complex subunit G [bacterium]|nr:RnfABCDGE type electron transport complex subunit G [Gammaproteobacteria bacterium]HIL96938.1 RnfABCDGE type electron transport complex subunit G [Pseudomonadales bacterium]